MSFSTPGMISDSKAQPPSLRQNMMLHKHLSKFFKDGMEGDYYWRDLNQNQDFKDLEAKMMVRQY